MPDRLRALWLKASHNLGVIPGCIVLLFAALGVSLVEVDRHVDLERVQWVFNGDGSAARTVLSVVAGSLITVAGLTFSITMVVLQLASSQFTPRILRTFFGDRVTQITIGTFIGTFVYAILVLRAVGSVGDAGFVPRLSITVASLLGMAAAVLLIVFLHHVSQLIQVSSVTAAIARQTLSRMDFLYAEDYGDGDEDEDAQALLASWRTRPPGRIFADRPGFVQRVGLNAVPGEVGEQALRVALLVCPGDFVSIETPIAEVWPADGVDGCRQAILAAVDIASERDLDQDVDFGLRQLTDTALKAMSPGVNDPTTAVTCIGYIRSILVRLTERRAQSSMSKDAPAVIVRQRSYEEHLEHLLQVSRYADGDGWVVGELLVALGSCAEVARGTSATERLAVIRSVAATIAEQAGREAKNDRDRQRVAALWADVRRGP